MSLRILIADDNAAVRSAVRTAIEGEADWKVCGEAGDGKTAVELATKLHPDVLVLDLSMPKMNGLEAARQIGTSRNKVILFTAHKSTELANLARAAGISAVVGKDGSDTLNHLVDAVKQTVGESRAA